jgi:hypothetical protein
MPDEEKKQETPIDQQAPVAPRIEEKSHIIHFTGPEALAIDLREIIAIRKKGKTLFFHSATRDFPVDMADDAAAEAFEPTALNLWAQAKADKK